MVVVTGDAPQPGETPYPDAPPGWFDPDAPWWRGDTDRERADALAEAAGRPRNPRRRAGPAGTSTGPAVYAPEHDEAVDAHAAAAHDTATALTAEAQIGEPLTGEPPTRETMAGETVAGVAAGPAGDAGDAADAADAADAETIAATWAVVESLAEHADATSESGPVAVERDHDERTRHRYHPPDEYQSPDDQATAELPDTTGPAPGVPESVLTLPETDGDRPTVSLERRAVPGQPSGLTRPSHARRSRARSAAADLDVKRSRMEHSPFWLNEGQRKPGNAWPAPEVRAGLAEVAAPGDSRRGRPPQRRPRTPHQAGAGLLALIAIGLIAAFFGWVSAEPFWLAVGHGDRGVATVAQCAGSGLSQRCAGSFTAADGSFGVTRVTLIGVGANSRDTGTAVPARMVSASSQQAYVGSTGKLVHLRWVLGFVLVLLCGLGIAGLTGTRQLETLRARRGALLMSLAGPVLLLAGFLAATY
jgi:hypothetical protein